MSRAGSNGVCLFCQLGLRPRMVYPATPLSTRRRLRHDRSELQRNVEEAQNQSFGFSKSQLQDQLELASATDVLRRVLLGPKQIQRGRNINERMRDSFQALRKAGPEATVPEYIRLRELNQEKQRSLDTSLDLVRLQLKACLSPEDAIRVLTVALQPSEHAADKDRFGAILLANPALQRVLVAQMGALGRIERLLPLWSLFITRLEECGQAVELGVIWEALKCAAATHSVVAIRRYLKMWSDSAVIQKGTMSKSSFLQLLYLLQRGYVEASSYTQSRNRLAYEEILLGFSDVELYGGCHVLSHMPPHDWECLSVSIELLAEIGAANQIWRYWDLVESHLKGVVRFTSTDKPNLDQEDQGFRRHGCETFIMALFRAGAPQRAWEIFQQHGLEMMENGHTSEYRGVRKDVWSALVDHARFKPELDDPLQEAYNEVVHSRLDTHLAHIEERMGVQWISSASNPEGGYHAFLNDDFEAAMEKLSGFELDLEGNPTTAGMEPGNASVTETSTWADASPDPTSFSATSETSLWRRDLTSGHRLPVSPGSPREHQPQEKRKKKPRKQGSRKIDDKQRQSDRLDSFKENFVRIPGLPASLNPQTAATAEEDASQRKRNPNPKPKSFM